MTSESSLTKPPSPQNEADYSLKEVKATKGNEVSVLKSLSVWIKKPHVVNRRLCGSQILAVFRCQTKEEADDFVARVEAEKDAVLSSGTGDKVETFTDLSEEKGKFTLLIRELIPKSEFFPDLLELIVYDKDEKSVQFIPVERPKQVGKFATKELTYKLQFQETDDGLPEWSQTNEIVLTWTRDVDIETEAIKCQMIPKWLCSVLLKKLVNWSQVDDISTAQTSLQLVSVDRYKETYVRLKNMYGRDLVKNWTERTDPQKFVYEDVAIAAYLLLIWEEDRQKKNLMEKQSFVDLGCGNGLLVYILTKEGHKGLGIDMRRRKIWDTFGPGIDLKEATVIPSGDQLFPEYDWIIGNHSDELTPWIPVIAARSKYSCNFFVLPCCLHDFVGKFNNTVKGKSQYAAYLDYVKEIVYRCGFHPEIDTLRIPSTKRVCLIGRERSYDVTSEPSVDKDRQNYIDKQIRSHDLRLGVKQDSEDLTEMDEIETSDAASQENSLSPTKGKMYEDTVTEASRQSSQNESSQSLSKDESSGNTITGRTKQISEEENFQSQIKDQISGSKTMEMSNQSFQDEKSQSPKKIVSLSGETKIDAMPLGLNRDFAPVSLGKQLPTDITLHSHQSTKARTQLLLINTDAQMKVPSLESCVGEALGLTGHQYKRACSYDSGLGSLSSEGLTSPEDSPGVSNVSLVDFPIYRGAEKRKQSDSDSLDCGGDWGLRDERSAEKRMRSEQGDEGQRDDSNTEKTISLEQRDERNIVKGLRLEQGDERKTEKQGDEACEVDGTSDTKWAENFKPRVEAGWRNCQRVAKSTKRLIVEKVFESVLGSDPTQRVLVGDGRSWRKGGAVPLGEVVTSLDAKTLKELKAECGGLQTLLRNHSHVFFVSKGVVRLRDFSEEDPWKGKKNRKSRGDEGRHKTTLCWFYDHHPDGCPRESDQCKFAHGSQDLREGVKAR